MKFLKQTYFFAINSVRRMWKAPLPFIIAFVLPVLAWTSLALTYQHSTIEDIPIAVVDLDNSPMSRMATRYLDGTGTLKLIDTYSNPAQAEEKFQRQETYYIVTFPKDFQKNIKLGGSTQVTIQFNGGKLIYAKIGYKAIAQCLSTISAGINIKRLEAKGLAPDDAKAKAVPVTTQLNVIGNPYFDYGIYLIPGMLFALLQMSASTCSLWVFRARREGNDSVPLAPTALNDLRSRTTNGVGRIIPNFETLLPYMLGQLFPLMLANALALAVMFLVIFPLVNFPITGTYFELFIFSCFFALVAMGIGAFLSINMRNLVTASQMLLIINAPAFVFGGYTFPTWAMPDWVQFLSQLMPLTHFLDGFFPLFIYGTPTGRGIIPLLITGGVFWGGTILSVLFYDSINRFKSHIRIN